MNVKERKGILARLETINRLTSYNESLKFTISDWNKMTKPPLISYVPPNVIEQVRRVVDSVRLMNLPSKKYKMVNEILSPLGIKPLASGTNRRTFYVEYDPSVVIKIASDRVGKRDNLSEFRLQEVVKPFCTKTFDVTPDGIMSLVERVETMTSYQFKYVYTGDIFDFIMLILDRGYIMEDIGGNFHKNWGLRVGFGPVILDYPYVFEVDYTKLRCSFVDPITKEKCDGYLDYDYSKGMSEIVCTKCGTRYSARSLAIEYNKESIINTRKRDNEMPLFNNTMKVFIKRGDKIVKRFYNETEVNEVENKFVLSERKHNPQNTTVARKSDSSFDNDGAKKKIYEKFTEKPLETTTFIYYPKDIKNDIIYFLKRQEKKCGTESTLRLAAILCIYYEPMDEEYKKEHGIKSQYEQKDIKANVTLHPKRHKEEENYETNLDAKKEENFPKVMVEEKKELSDFEKLSIQNIINESVSKEELEKFNNDDKEKENLYPVKALTKEEEEALRDKSSTENVVSGIIGVSLVDTMREKQTYQRLKEEIINKFDGTFTEDSNLDETTSNLSNDIKELVREDLTRINNGDFEGVNVSVTKTVDVKNNECFDIVVKNYSTTVIECSLYPSNGKSNKETEGDKTMLSDDVLTFLDSKLKDVEGDYESEEEAKSSVASSLYGSFKDEFKDKYTPARMMEICKEYTDRYVDFGFKKDDTYGTTADEL